MGLTPGIKLLQACLNLPAIESIRVRDAYWPLSLTTREKSEYQFTRSTVRSIHLGQFVTFEYESVVEAILAAPQNLKDFGLTHYQPRERREYTGIGYEKYGQGLQTPDLVNMLLTYAKGSLESLSLRCWLHQTKAIDGHNGFTKLRILDIEIAILTGGHLTDGQLIAKAMPISLQHLILREDGSSVSSFQFDGKEFRQLLKDFITSKRLHLPALEEFEVYLLDTKDMYSKHDY